MRPASSALIAFLLTKQPFMQADLLTISTTDGAVYRFSSGDKDVTVGLVTYSGSQTPFTRSRWNVQNTIETPTLELQLFDDGTKFPAGDLRKLANNGYFDGAIIELDRAIMPTWGDVSLGTIALFGGRAAGLEITGTGMKMTVKGLSVAFDQYLPRNLFADGCIHNLYDSGCTMLKATFTFFYTVAVANTTFIEWTIPPPNPEYFNMGGLVMTSGAANGQTRTIASATSLGIQLAFPLFDFPVPGDTFEAFYGCTKARGSSGEATPNCTTPFANTAHYRGFKFIPPAETAF